MSQRFECKGQDERARRHPRNRFPRLASPRPILYFTSHFTLTREVCPWYSYATFMKGD
uniref:Uncharacterized protein n=1 Tax=Candidatus Kentrum sp. MB TaxID=2138164 RepID=A0A451BEU3_9GAMM|nr:MAG: hypothetical protein BECKMB1821G_GA0114241_107013 [Candidatus Kentron sp. MB]VFK34516.1 MAG: hypothetical protein BECKMB1821I_GA0114274_10749 [Candidatus Kentron sp. MB]VFK76796.1 MAG: hypothetical protein BECKMB1821H_GA0114242_10759 [Candidatus Kentron sp. MB]